MTSSLTQSMTCLFRPPSASKKQLLEQRRASESHNQTHSSFHNLPTEILALVGCYAPGLSLTALRQTSKRFRSIYSTEVCKCWIEEFKTVFYCNLDSLVPGYFNGDDLSEWRLALKREQYRDKCRRDNADKEKGRSRLRCSSCLSKHGRSSFSDKQLLADAEARTCKAAETGGVQTCNHLILTFAAMQRLRTPGSASRPTFGALAGRHADSSTECPSAMGLHFCTETRKREFLHPTLGCGGSAPNLSEPIRYTEPWTYKLVLQYTLLHLPAKANVYISVVANKLLTLVGDICAHVPMSGQEVLRSFYHGTIRGAFQSGRTVRWINDFHDTLPRDYRCTTIRSCRQPGCDTKFRIALETPPESGNQKVHLLVQRDIGRLEDANDLKWLNQAVVPLGIQP